MNMHDDGTAEREAAFETCDYDQADVAELAQLFRDAINTTAHDAYTPEQRAAWASKADDEAAFAASLNEGWVRIAVDDEGIAGFAQINMPGHIAMLYTAPRVARQGVATVLLDDMLALGEAMGAERLSADASSLARGLFAYFGFEDDGTEVVERNGVNFTRYKMSRRMKKR